jgi:hypothetical protein
VPCHIIDDALDALRIAVWILCHAQRLMHSV